MLILLELVLILLPDMKPVQIGLSAPAARSDEVLPSPDFSELFGWGWGESKILYNEVLMPDKLATEIAKCCYDRLLVAHSANFNVRTL